MNNTLITRDGQTIILPTRINNSGLEISRHFTSQDTHPYAQVSWKRINLEIKDHETGKHRFKRDQIEVPAHWDHNAILITSDKYLYGTQSGTPEYEDSLKHPFDRIANTYTVWAWEQGYILSLESLLIFNEELKYMLVQQIWAPNSPVWFNVGHFEQWRWGRPDLRNSSPKGNKAFYARTENMVVTAYDANTMEYPQCSACFLTEVSDSMESILDHLKVEGRIFSSGSGVGINLSTLRSSVEPITSKGKSSGPISFDKGWDRMAGAIKSGGKTRRAARMVLMYGDHPDIFRFIQTKNEQEEFAKIILREHNVSSNLRKIAHQQKNLAPTAARFVEKILSNIPSVNDTEYSKHMDGLLYGETLAHQNANHSVSLKGEFWKALKSGGQYSTRWVTDPDRIHETFPASKILHSMAESVHSNGEPGLHNNDWINLWNPVKNDGNISTSNPCSEYLHMNNTSCNLSSFNVYRFWNSQHETFNAESLRFASLLAMICGDLNIEKGGFPIPEIAVGTYTYRTTGIGFANLGGLLMSLGVPYDSDDARWIASQLASLLTASCFEASAAIGKIHGGYPAFNRTKDNLRQVITLHKCSQELNNAIPESSKTAINELTQSIYQNNINFLPAAQGLTGLDALNALANSYTGKEICPAIRKSFNQVKDKATTIWSMLDNDSHVFRNSFVSVMAPTGTISAPLGCYDEGTTSIEPDYTLVKYKQLSGGGSITMFNRLALQGLKKLGYDIFLIKEAALEVAGISGLLIACNQSEPEAITHLTAKLTHPGPVRKALIHLYGADAGSIVCKENILSLQGRAHDPTLSIDEKLIIQGSSHLEKLPWINPEHLPVFDCSSNNGDGERSISPEGHLRMLGAIQPFISGASSKTCNLSYSATVADIENSFLLCHNLGIKCIALFRAESKANSVYQVDTPEGRKYDAHTIWNQIVAMSEEMFYNSRREYSTPTRRKLRGRRLGMNIKFTIGGTLKGYLSVGVYSDGSCGEVFARVGTSGSYSQGVLDAFCKAISVQLQFGIPLDDILEDFSGITFEPNGFTLVEDDNDEGRAPISSASSVIDLIMKILNYLFSGPNRTMIPLNDTTSMPDWLHLSRGDIKEGVININTAISPNAASKKSSNICPKCNQLTYINDGKCKRCINTSCLFKDGGCGE